MNVFLLTEEPYHDNSEIKGGFETLKKAQESLPLQWEKVAPASREFIQGVVNCWEAASGEDFYVIRELVIR